MVSAATSGSSAHSEVHAQETANHLDEFKPISQMDVDSRVVEETVKEVVGNSVERDVVATNIESNVVVNGGVAAKTESGIVASKVENGVVATNTESQTARSRNLDQEFEKNNQNLLQKEASVDSLFFCGIPDLDCANQKFQSIATEEVTVPLCMDQLPKSTLLSTTLLQPPDGLAQTINNKLNIRQPSWCEPCKVSCSSDKCFERQNSEKQHLKNLEALEKIMSPPSITSIVPMQSTPIYKPVQDLKSSENRIGDSDESKIQWCEVCKISCTSDDIRFHLLGKKHTKNLQMSLIKPKCKVVDPNEGNAIWCEVCQIRCYSPKVFDVHILGKQHKNNLRKSETRFGLGGAPSLAARTLHDSSDEESKVVVLESCKRKANSSSANEEDVNTKRQKVIEEEGESGATVICSVCKVVCNGTMGFKVHLASQEHFEMALKQANL